MNEAILGTAEKHMSEPEYLRIKREKAEKAQQIARLENNKAAEDANVEKLADAIKGVAQELKSEEDENSPNTKWERTWRKREVYGLWFAAFVGIAAIVVSSVDSHTQLQELRGEQRAWVGTSNANVVGNVEIGKPLKIEAAIINTGRDPALNFVGSMHPFLTTSADIDSGKFAAQISEAIKTCFAKPSRTSAQVMFPSNGFGGGYSFSTTIQSGAINSDIISGHKIIVVPGCLVYDTINKTRHTSFCYYYRSKLTQPANLNICTIGNTAD